MAKSREKKPRPKNYEEPLKVNGSFLDIMKAAAKNANDKSKKKGS